MSDPRMASFIANGVMEEFECQLSDAVVGIWIEKFL